MVAALSVRNLSISAGRDAPLLSQFSFDLAAGERVGLIGASGCGKSLTAAALCGLLRPPLQVTEGAVQLDNRELLALPPTEWRNIRGRQIFQVFQSPGTALSPARRIGPQLTETARIARVVDEQIITKALEKVSLDPDVLKLFPYQLSGGMKQRVLIAMALILRPRILIADEPTTGLDVLTEREILTAINDMVDETGAALLFISHDLRAVREVANRTLVMQDGRLVEDTHVSDLDNSNAPAAKSLAEAALKLGSTC